MKQKVFLLMVLALVMYSATGIAQEKEYQIGQYDGFEWYKVKKVVNGEKKYGAEDRYGNTIVPTEYSEMWYCSDDNPILTGFGPSKGKYMSWYNKSGKCIVPYTRGYTWISKCDNDEFGTYYNFRKPDGGGILDRNGKEVAFVKVNNLDYINIEKVNIEKGVKYYLSFAIKKDGKKYEGFADAYGNIIVEPEYEDYLTAYKLAQSRFTTNNPLAGNRHETLAEAEGRPQGGQRNPVAGQQQQQGGGTKTIVVEHHRDPVPVQQWQACWACGGMGTMACDNCGGSGTKYIGDRLHICSRCNGQRIIPCNICYGNKGQYITVYQ